MFSLSKWSRIWQTTISWHHPTRYKTSIPPYKSWNWCHIEHGRTLTVLPEVTTGVESSIAPIYRSIPYSSSAKPWKKEFKGVGESHYIFTSDGLTCILAQMDNCHTVSKFSLELPSPNLTHNWSKNIVFTSTSPLPSRAPVLGSTATEPMTIRSTLILWSSPIGFPYLATPTEEQASLILLGGNILDSRTEKNPVRRRGWGVNNFFPPTINQSPIQHLLTEEDR